MNLGRPEPIPTFIKLIFLYGPPGSGKTSVGKVLAEKLAVPFVDLDQRIEGQAGMSVPEIFGKRGEAGFRQLEKTALREVLKLDWGVIALGGGTLLDPDNRALVEAEGSILCLSAADEVLLERLESASIERPLLTKSGSKSPDGIRLVDLLAQRAQHYTTFTNQMETDTKSLEQVSWAIQVQLGVFHVRGMARPSGANHNDGSIRPFPLGYDVRIQAGALDGLGKALMMRELSGPTALVTDQNVAEFYIARAVKSLQESGYPTSSIIIPPGESSKTMPTVSYLWQEFLESGLERKSTVVALGGGVVGDLAGFAAATFMRAVPWVNVPTSLLAIADASLGGKTGVDLPEGKNLVGAFNAPEMVLTDPSTLSTLPQDELCSGMAEVLKAGIIGDPDLFYSCTNGWSAIEADWDEIIPRAMAVKIQIIEADPYEEGLRAALNYGHTIGHAVERASNYQLRHGEAVAIGMVAEARLAEQLGLAQEGLAEEIENVCVLLGLPVEIPENLSRASILEAMRVDKKRSDKKIRFALPTKIGEVITGIEVDDIDLILK